MVAELPKVVEHSDLNAVRNHSRQSNPIPSSTEGRVFPASIDDRFSGEAVALSGCCKG